jgi:hypothetical protein
VTPRFVIVRADGPGAMRVVASDWPLAALLGGAILLPGLAVLVWSIVDGHAVEGGGAVVFVAMGLFALRLGMRHRRELTITRDGTGLRVCGVEGAGPWRRGLDLRLGGSAAARVDPLPGAADARTADGACLPDRGGDLVLSDGVLSVRIARGVGPAGTAQLAAARAALALV